MKGGGRMPQIVKTMKLHIHANSEQSALFKALTKQYALACNYISQYVFSHGVELNYMKLQTAMYQEIRNTFGLKAQMTISSFKTVVARYKTVEEQLAQSPYKYYDENGAVQYIQKTLEWLQKPVCFRRPQADLVRGRDYSFVNGGKELSINTLGKRVKVSYDVPECFRRYFDGTWSFGTAKLVSLNGEWYFHIPVTREQKETFDRSMPAHVVGIDRGLRFLACTYDERRHSSFCSGKSIMRKRQKFIEARASLQARGTKSAKRRLKALSGRENRWMSDINHQTSKTLTRTYGPGTLFVIENLTGVSFSEQILSTRTVGQRTQIRSWAFYQLEQMLTYKAEETGSAVIRVPANYTSQRCPRCGRIHKENRKRETHEYVCDCCGYRSNDDRIGAINLQALGTMYVSGDNNPRFGIRKKG